jgi:hypothetical protein
MTFDRAPARIASLAPACAVVLGVAGLLICSTGSEAAGVGYPAFIEGRLAVPAQSTQKRQDGKAECGAPPLPPCPRAREKRQLQPRSLDRDQPSRAAPGSPEQNVPERFTPCGPGAIRPCDQM